MTARQLDTIYRQLARAREIGDRIATMLLEQRLRAEYLR